MRSGMFSHVIELDPSLSQGHAGSAQVLTSLALITPDRAVAAQHLEDARAFAETAITIDPTDAWAQGSMGWVLSVSGQFDDALVYARRAFDLEPENGHVLDLISKTAVVAIDPELVANASDPARPRSGVGRFAAQNFWGLSQYMLGDYAKTIEAFSEAPATGAPVSPPSLVFLAVAHDHLGNTAEARKLVSELKETWPDLPVAFLVGQIFHAGSEYERDIMSRLERNGYTSD